MSDAATGRAVPIWMIVLCWLLSIQIVIDTEFWLWIKLPVYLPFLVLTIVLFRRRSPSSA